MLYMILARNHQQRLNGNSRVSWKGELLLNYWSEKR
jgi:hypothetical protein